MSVKVALIYDFDKTLSPRDMQSYDFIKKLGISDEQFWKDCDKFCFEHQTDRILGYMYMMIQSYKEKGLEITRDYMMACGKNIEYYKGVETWFDRINKFGKNIGVEIEHYIVSSGIKEMIDGCSIAKYFKEIYAGYFVYDEHSHPIWPALAINYTNKTQCIYRINKGILNVVDDSVNENMPRAIRPVPFQNMIYIGDSMTDIPCMRLVMKNGGYAIGICQQDKRNKEYLKNLINDDRINYIVEADYSKNSELENVVKEIIETVKHNDNLKELTRKHKDKLNEGDKI